jgi:hypothetical protein
MPSPRRDSTKKKLVEFERSFGLLMNKLGNFESDTIISMFNTQMQGDSVWKASVNAANERVVALTKQRDDLQAELLMLREKDYTVQNADGDVEQCAFGGSHLLKRLNSSSSPSRTEEADAADTAQRPSTAGTDAASDSGNDIDLLQFKPINTTMLEISAKKANLKTDKLLETERILAALKMGVCALVERLVAVNMITPELKDLLAKGPPAIDINEDNCCSALDHFTAILMSLLDSFDDELSPLAKAPARSSPSNASPERRCAAVCTRVLIYSFLAITGAVFLVFSLGWHLCSMEAGSSRQGGQTAVFRSVQGSLFRCCDGADSRDDINVDGQMRGY